MDIISKITSGLTTSEILDSYLDKLNIDSKSMMLKLIPLADLWAEKTDDIIHFESDNKEGDYYKIPIENIDYLQQYIDSFFSQDDYTNIAINTPDGDLVSIMCDSGSGIVSAAVGGPLNKTIDIAFEEDDYIYLRTKIPMLSADENTAITVVKETAWDTLLQDVSQNVTMKDIESSLCNEILSGNQDPNSIFNKIAMDIPAMRDAVLESFQELREIATFAGIGGLIQHLRLGFNSITTGHKSSTDSSKIEFDDTDYSIQSFKLSVSLAKVFTTVGKIVGTIVTFIYAPVGIAINMVSSGVELVYNKIVENVHLTNIELNSNCDDGSIATSAAQGYWSVRDQDSPHSLLKALFEGNQLLAFKVKSYGLVWYIWRNEVHDDIGDDLFYYECHIDFSVKTNFFDTELAELSYLELNYDDPDIGITPIGTISYDLPGEVYQSDSLMAEYRMAFNDLYNESVGDYLSYSEMSQLATLRQRYSNAISWIVGAMLIYRKYEFNITIPQGVELFHHYCWWENSSVYDRLWVSFALGGSSTAVQIATAHSGSVARPDYNLNSIFDTIGDVDHLCKDIFITDVTGWSCTAYRTAPDAVSYTMHQMLLSQDGVTCLFATKFNNDGTITSNGILTFDGTSIAIANVYIAQFSKKGKYYIIPPSYTRVSLVITAVLTTLVVATITIGVFMVSSKIKRTIRRKMSSSYREVERLRNDMHADDPASVAAYDKAVTKYNLKAKVFGYSSLNRVDGWQAGADAAVPDFTKVYKLLTPKWREV